MLGNVAILGLLAGACRTADPPHEQLPGIHQAFYDFPAAHWVHLRTTNPIESTFATVRLRTRATKGVGTPTGEGEVPEGLKGPGGAVRVSLGERR